MSKAINEMNCLSDMGKLPWAVNLGASLNIVFTIWVTRLFFLRVNGELLYLIPFSLAFVIGNLLPVVILRWADKQENGFSEVEEMNFFADQHRFSTWVYAVASANMFFWIVTSWCLFSHRTETTTLILLQALAFVVTYVPLWRRFIKS